MRVLFYVGDRSWTGRARAFVVAARGLIARGHQATIVCGAGTPVVERIAGNGIDTVLIDPDDNPASRSWELRKILRDRFIEVAFVHDEAEHLAVGTAMRLAERGAVIRRIPPFVRPRLDPGIVTRRLASGGLLFSTRADFSSADGAPWPLPPTLAPVGIDTSAYDAIQPIPRSAFGLSENAVLIGCPFDASGRPMLANVFRVLKLLAAHHRELYAVVVGPDAKDEHLRLHAAAVGVSQRLAFVSDAADDRAVLATCDIVWVAAAGDGGAYGLLDSMALQRPTVASRMPLSEYYVADGISGVLLADSDTDAVAAALASLLADPARRGAMAGAGRARVQRDFTETAMIDGFEQAVTAAGDRSRWVAR